ncbi:MAG: iron ABC transporter permease [Thermomicrobiales bacterium]|nr:iron ABC transporter permease [Thermomicrobiales bacterium]
MATAITSDLVAPPVPRARTWSRAGVLALAGFLALFVVSAIHVRQGAPELGIRGILEAIVTPDGSLQHTIVRYALLPRTAAGIVAGAALGMAGVMLQAATRNPLASETTIGVNAGAFLAVVAATIYAPSLMAWGSTPVAFSGGLLAAMLVYLLGSGSNPTRLALAGMATTLSLGAISTVLIIFNEYTVTGINFWGSGALIQRNWDKISTAWPWVLMLGLAITFLLGRQLDILWLGDDTATALGQHVWLTRTITVIAGVLLAALAVTVVGMIGFVGLVAPHLVRLAGVRRHALIVPLAALWGSVIVVSADVIGRWVAGPMDEIPAGVFTALAGAPWLIWLARRTAAGSHQTESPERAASASSRTWPVWLLAVTLLCIVIVAGLALGDQFRSLTTLWDVATGQSDDLTRVFVVDYRLPRVLVAGMAGAALSVSGLMIQGIVRNPLASPDLAGVSGGAGVGALAVMVAFPNVPISWLPVAAFFGGVLAFAIVYLASWSNGGVAPIRLALVGVGVSAACASIITMFVVRAEMHMTTALSWLAGSTYARTWSHVLNLLPWLVVLMPLAWICAKWLDMMALGEELPRTLGIPLERARLLILGTAVALASAAVAICGTIGFVGLIGPHAARLLLPGKHRALIPFAAVIGAILVIVADTIGRTALAPREIPTGLVTALIGTPYFLWLLYKAR